VADQDQVSPRFVGVQSYVLQAAGVYFEIHFK
jgi:hypothetical protein